MPLHSPKYLEAKKRLPEHLKPVMQRLTQEYEFQTAVHYGKGYVAYQVLADLVLAGWRPTDEAATPARQ